MRVPILKGTTEQRNKGSGYNPGDDGGGRGGSRVDLGLILGD